MLFALRGKLLAVSASTIDRMLAPDRARLALKGRPGTKPGTLLKHQIPVRTFAGWDEARPGWGQRACGQPASAVREIIRGFDAEWLD